MIFILIQINFTIFSIYSFIENNSSIIALLVLVPINSVIVSIYLFIQQIRILLIFILIQINSTIFDIYLFTQKPSGILTTFRINSSKFD